MPLPYAANSRSLTRAAAFLRAHPDALVVAGSRHAADDLVRTACESALIGVERYSLRELVYALSSDPMNARGLVPLHRIAREALAAVAASRTDLSYLRPVARFPGFPRALARTLEELRLNRVEAAKLAVCGRSGADLAALLGAYEKQLEEHRFADYALRVDLAIGALQPRPVVLLDLQPPSRLERDLVGQIVNLQAGCQPAESADSQSASRLTTGPTLLSAPSEALECVEIARRILHSGVPFDRCAVLLRNPQRHEPLIREAFDRAGIPAWFAAGARRPDLGGRAFVALLRCRQDNVSAERFAEYLSLGQTPREEGQSTSGWERRLREAKVIGGLQRWQTRLDAVADALAREYEEQPDQRLAYRIGSLEALKGFALPVMTRLAALPDQAHWREWIDALETFAPLVLKNPRSVIELLDELRPVADFGPVSLQQVVLTLERNLLTWQDEEESTRYGKVFVASIEEARGMSFRNVYVPGLNEGLFPRPVSEDPLLLDAQRIELGMPTSQDDTELLNIVAACASEEAVFSYSRLDLATGRERVKSFFAFEVMPETGEEKLETTIGWSAPAEPLRAIDDIEYDIASIRRDWKQEGALAWLTSASEPMARSVRARQRRWSRDWTDADGLSGDDIHAAQLLGEYGLKAKAWSPSELQNFAMCPYRFYLHGVLGLREVEEPEQPQRLDPRAKGDLYHRVQSAMSGPVTPDTLEAELERLDAVLERISGELAAENQPMIPAVWRAGVDAIRGDLRGWLYYRAYKEPDWSAIATEHKFNVTLAEGWRLSGAIDVIERHESGAVRITDFKTGLAPKEPLQHIGGGELLQPALYGLAAESLGHDVTSARLAYATLRSNFRIDAVQLDAHARMSASNVLSAIDSWIGKGFLPAAPREKACERCEYVPICGPYEELRVRCKSSAELRPLQQIRDRK